MTAVLRPEHFHVPKAGVPFLGNDLTSICVSLHFQSFSVTSPVEREFLAPHSSQLHLRVASLSVPASAGVPSETEVLSSHHTLGAQKATWA